MAMIPPPKGPVPPPPPMVANDYDRLRRPDAVAAAESDGYAKNPAMQRAQQPGKQSKQYGLPKSGKGLKAPRMKGGKNAL